MALNFEQAGVVSSIPTRVRSSQATPERDEVYKEFFEAIERAKAMREQNIAAGMTEHAADNKALTFRLKGEAECKKYQRARDAFEKDHPNSWACLHMADGVYDGSKTLEITLYVAARPMAKHLDKLAKKGSTK